MLTDKEKTLLYAASWGDYWFLNTEIKIAIQRALTDLAKSSVYEHYCSKWNSRCKELEVELAELKAKIPEMLYSAGDKVAVEYQAKLSEATKNLAGLQKVSGEYAVLLGRSEHEKAKLEKKLERVREVIDGEDFSEADKMGCLP